MISVENEFLEPSTTDPIGARRIDRVGKARAAVRGVRILPGERMVDVVREPRAVYGESDVPLSTSARLVRQQVQIDVTARPRVGYRRSFLEEYRPNETFYLPEPDRERLRGYDVMYGAAVPEGSYGRALMERLLIDLSWSSSRLEGSTYSRLETQRLIEQGIAAENKSRKELQMILNHKEAIQFLLPENADIGLNAYTLLNLHALLSDDLIGTHDRGRLRTGRIFIAESAYEPLANREEIAERFTLLVQKAAGIRNPFEQAFFLLVHLPYLQPFWDVNKRVSRVAANIPLIRAQAAPLSFVDVPKRMYLDALLAVYELNRLELLRELFIWAYDRSCYDYENLHSSAAGKNPLRFKYRAVLRDTVRGIVESGESPDGRSIALRATPVVSPEDVAAFVDWVLSEITGLHEGNIALYRISLQDYRRWQQKAPAATSADRRLRP